MLTYTKGKMHINCSINKCKQIAIVYKSNPNGYTDDRIYYCGIHFLNRCKAPILTGGK